MSSEKTKVAFFDFAGCEGCQLTVLDTLQHHLELLEVIEITRFREAMSESEGDFQIAFVEGSCVWPSDEDRLRDIRQQAEIVIALGACAHLGGINAIRNAVTPEDAARIVYQDQASAFLTQSARPINEVIDVDAYVPGCPINPSEFLALVTSLLQGAQPRLVQDPVCVECKLRESVCLLTCGRSCLGPITWGGCGAICPAFGVGCEGCRGLLLDANTHSLSLHLLEAGHRGVDTQRRMQLFLSHQLSQTSMIGNEG